MLQYLSSQKHAIRLLTALNNAFYNLKKKKTNHLFLMYETFKVETKPGNSTFHYLLSNIDIKVASCKVIKEKQRLCPRSNNVIHAHRNLAPPLRKQNNTQKPTQNPINFTTEKKKKIQIPRFLPDQSQ